MPVIHVAPSWQGLSARVRCGVAAGIGPFAQAPQRDDAPDNRLHFDLVRVMHTGYRIDDFQQVYFIINSFRELLNATYQDFAPLYERMSVDRHVHDIEDILETDRVYTRGTQAYARSGGRAV